MSKKSKMAWLGAAAAGAIAAGVLALIAVPEGSKAAMPKEAGSQESPKPAASAKLSDKLSDSPISMQIITGPYERVIHYKFYINPEELAAYKAAFDDVRVVAPSFGFDERYRIREGENMREKTVEKKVSKDGYYAATMPLAFQLKVYGRKGSEEKELFNKVVRP